VELIRAGKGELGKRAMYLYYELMMAYHAKAASFCKMYYSIVRL
jgi:hypothetical protein